MKIESSVGPTYVDEFSPNARIDHRYQISLTLFSRIFVIKITIQKIKKVKI